MFSLARLFVIRYKTHSKKNHNYLITWGWFVSVCIGCTCPIRIGSIGARRDSGDIALHIHQPCSLQGPVGEFVQTHSVKCGWFGD